MLRMPVEEVVLPVLEALSRLASKCSIILAEQVCFRNSLVFFFCLYTYILDVE
jgi:hypothetical protein